MNNKYNKAAGIKTRSRSLRSSNRSPFAFIVTEECSICLESYKKPIITNCGHCFCSSCINRCYKTRKECPVCRQVLIKSLFMEYSSRIHGPIKRPALAEEKTTGKKSRSVVKR